jgi:NAD(P)-dependent dehydrogenase (short-subunit alcohol dehydrogenase family)
MDYLFSHRVAFVTGAANGIGKATANAFSASGAHVVLADTNIEVGQEVASEIRELGGSAHFIRCDVSKASDVEEAVKEAVKRFGRIDFAFNNAGIEGEQGSTADCTASNWQRVLDVNLTGVWHCMKYQIPEMLRQGGGTIVNCSSVAGLVGFEGIPAYVASKHGVVGLTKCAALELAKKNIRVNAVCPGVIQTPMIERFTHGEAQAQRLLVDGEPIGRVGQPSEVAMAVLWLCSSQSTFVTGHCMAVDGGWTAH